MISLRKLKTLAEGNRRRKTVFLIRDFERSMLASESWDSAYLDGLLGQIRDDDGWPESLRRSAEDLINTKNRDPGSDTGRALNNLRHGMLTALGKDWADWDAEFPKDTTGITGQSAASFVYPIHVYLDGLRSPFNVGSAARTASAFGAKGLFLSPECPSLDHPRARRSAMGAADSTDWRRLDRHDLISGDYGRIIGLELGGTKISKFRFPDRGTVVLGSEELGISPELMNAAREDGGIVTIPLPGPKASLNVGVALGILLQYWVEDLERG